MKITLTLAALALSMAPAFAGPGCGDKMKEETAASCAAGTTWDPATSSCVAATTS